MHYSESPNIRSLDGDKMDTKHSFGNMSHRLLSVVILLYSQLAYIKCYSDNSTGYTPSVIFFPTKYEGLVEHSTATVYYNISNPGGYLDLRLNFSHANDPSFLSVLSMNSTEGKVGNMSFDGSFTIQGNMFGRTLLNFKMLWNASYSRKLADGLYSYEVSVVRQKTILTKVFLYVLGGLIVLYNIGFGCKIRAGHIRDILKRPVGPIIGLVCQFTIMAPVSILFF